MQAYINLICVREYRLWAQGRPVDLLASIGLLPADLPPADGLQSLRKFCETGARNTGRDGEAVLFAKELLYYRVLDVFAQVYCAEVEGIMIKRSNFPFVNLLVRTFVKGSWHWGALTPLLPSEPLQPRALAETRPLCRPNFGEIGWIACHSTSHKCCE